MCTPGTTHLDPLGYHFSQAPKRGPAGLPIGSPGPAGAGKGSPGPAGAQQAGKRFKINYFFLLFVLTKRRGAPIIEPSNINTGAAK